ncbi:class I adenylate-forming enzyme family protein [Bdellovibrio reynosensis]|uniref:Long-chain fatty acid--CoA ligase n=1 Tax=Bdellovibrio reynosensis TaxID=2835041 RepID=A0ABY4C9H6_9BACT|nr:long-chain fatty acid--CoA ligase [Bdellovibrio reynosensis]UOF00148.1 long-chain fatty acid--CoA ligase [Bdellovibrio reynosensis]
MELDWLKHWNLETPNKIAIKDGDSGKEIPYADLFRLSNQAARFLINTYQIKKGDRVAVLSTNELEYVFLFFALQRLGAILVPINFRLTQREVDHIISDSQPQLVLFQEAFGGIVENLEFKVQKLLLQKPDNLVPESDSFADVIHLQPNDEVPFTATENDPVMILYTSGTTGAPKGALLSLKMIYWNSVNTQLRLNLQSTDCTVIFLPFFHTGGWNVLTTPFIHAGGKLVFLKKFDAEQVLKLSEKEKATILFGVPTTMDMMARTPVFKNYDLQKIRYAIVGGEPMPVELIKTWADKGIPVRQGYGLTEFGPNVFSLNEEDALRKIGSIGFPNHYVEAKVVNDEGQELAADEIGELILRGPVAMQGYWNNPKATEETLRDGWLHTGDLVRKDSEGYFYVVGRKKDMFISGGENVYPAEVEQILRSHPGVLEAAVIGVKDEKWGEVGKAFVVTRDEELTAEALRTYCLKNLAKFKTPHHYAFLPNLPKGDSGKILKRLLLNEGFPSK